MSPNKRFLVGQSMDNKIVTYENGGTFKYVKQRTFKGHLSAGYACETAFSPDNQFLTSGDGDGKLWFWGWKNGKNYKTFQQAHRTGPREAARRLLSTHGPRGLVLTWPLSFVRFAVALSVFFGSYDQIKSRVVGDSTQRPAAATFALRALSGGLSGILTW